MAFVLSELQSKSNEHPESLYSLPSCFLVFFLSFSQHNKTQVCTKAPWLCTGHPSTPTAAYEVPFCTTPGRPPNSRGKPPAARPSQAGGRSTEVGAQPTARHAGRKAERARSRCLDFVLMSCSGAM